jgi:hypothetical protein
MKNKSSPLKSSNMFADSEFHTRLDSLRSKPKATNSQISDLINSELLTSTTDVYVHHASSPNKLQHNQDE